MQFKQVFPSLFATSAVSVQPMIGPTGLAFALRFLYEASFAPCVFHIAYEALRSGVRKDRMEYEFGVKPNTIIKRGKTCKR